MSKENAVETTFAADDLLAEEEREEVEGTQEGTPASVAGDENDGDDEASDDTAVDDERAADEDSAVDEDVSDDADAAEENAADIDSVDEEPADADAADENIADIDSDSDDAAADDDIFIVEDDEDDAEGVHYMQNRELSWLTFNERVLDQGADESVPLLERLNFISIFWSNLREFFMVRVGSLTDLSFIEPPIIDSKTGMTAKEQIRAIHERCSELYPIQESYYEHVRGSLAKQGVRHLRPEDLSDEQRNYLFGLVQHNIEPFLSPQIINSRHPFPHIENGKLYILVRLDDVTTAEQSKKKKGKEKAKKKEKGGAEGVLLGLIPLPHQCERVIKLPGRGFQFILLEHAIEMFVPEIFHMYKIKHTNVICVTRNADIDANQGFDEQDEDYREHMKRLLKKRARLAPVRLECERPLSPVMEKLMLAKLGLKRFQVYDTIVPLDLSFTWGLGSRLSDKKRESLTPEPFAPAWPTCFDRNRRIIDQVSECERLMFYPYESMDPFVQLLREASTDPSVVSIKITLYRLASQSHLAEALINAADNGKEVTALFELRARFDESNNIMWSQRFEEAGCHVIYGFRDYKVHSKICCITRQTPDGVQHITQLGTGNYNEKTAKLYTDMSFITTDETFGRDAMEFFRNMQLENVSDNYEILRVAPLQIKPLILNSLDEQIANARAGKPANAFMKANSITDKDVIEKISEASNAGVKITLFIRGICCIVPGVKGATENVRVFSIVGRLLEHSRIYCFGTEEDSTVYLSSADLMTRNLNKRVEIAWPVNDPELRGRVLTYLDVCMHDTAKLRELRPNATYTPLGAFCDLDEDGNPCPSFDAQNALIEQAAQAARDAQAMAEEQAAAEAEIEAEEAEAELAVEPEPEPAIEPVVELEPEPAIEPAVELATEPAIEPEAEPAIEPEVELETEPAIEPEVGGDIEAAYEAAQEPAAEERIDTRSGVDRSAASGRVAALIDQLGTAAEQKTEPAFERLTDMRIDDLLPLEDEQIEGILPDEGVQPDEPLEIADAPAGEALDDAGAPEAFEAAEELAADIAEEAAAEPEASEIAEEPLAGIADEAEAEPEAAVAPEAIEAPGLVEEAEAVDDLAAPEAPEPSEAPEEPEQPAFPDNGDEAQQGIGEQAPASPEEQPQEPPTRRRFFDFFRNLW